MGGPRKPRLVTALKRARSCGPADVYCRRVRTRFGQQAGGECVSEDAGIGLRAAYGVFESGCR